MIKLIKYKNLKDKNGQILLLINKNYKYLNLINIKKNKLRGNHYHIKNSHYLFVLSGEIFYFEKKKKINFIKLKKNDLIFTKYKVPHAIFAKKNSIILEFGIISNKKKIYDQDTRNLNFIDKKNLDIYI